MELCSLEYRTQFDVARIRTVAQHRRFVAGACNIALLGLLLMVGHSHDCGLHAGDGQEDGQRLRHFAICSEVLVCLLVAAWVTASTWSKRWFAKVLQVVLLWYMCVLLSTSTPSRRRRLLGLDVQMTHMRLSNEEGVTASWVAILLLSAAFSVRVRPLLFALFCQVLCVQHLLIGLTLSAPEHDARRTSKPTGPLLGMPPLVTASLQLHLLAVLAAAMHWCCDADRRVSELAQSIVSGRLPAPVNGKVSPDFHSDSPTVKNVLEVLVEATREEELVYRHILASSGNQLPALTSAADWVEALSGILTFMANKTNRLESQSTALHQTRAAHCHSTRSSAASVEPSPSGIQAFCEQSFMAQEVQNDTGNNIEDTMVEDTDKLGGSKPEVHVQLSFDVNKYHLREWDFDALQVESECGNVLQRVGFEYLHGFQILNADALRSSLEKLEGTYVKENPYHTHVHAADVCNTVFFLVSRSGLWSDALFSDTRRISIILAALGHDAGHFGRTNAFLIAINHSLAITYNDKSVMENFHAATLFRIVCEESCAPGAGSDEQSGSGIAAGRSHGIFAGFTSEMYNKARQLVVALILATDTQHHLEALAVFRLRLTALENSSSADTFDPAKNAKDQQEVLTIMMRAADIGHSAKGFVMHHEWSCKITDEFHKQGDAECQLGLPISPLCDRRGFNMASAQVGFLQFICIPTWKEIARFEAGPPSPSSAPASRLLSPSPSNASNSWRVSVRQSISGVRDSYQHSRRASSASRASKSSMKSTDCRIVPSLMLNAAGNMQGGPAHMQQPPNILKEVCLNQCEENLQEWQRQLGTAV